MTIELFFTKGVKMKRWKKVAEPELRYKGMVGWAYNAIAAIGSQVLPKLDPDLGNVVAAGRDGFNFVIRFPYLGSYEFPYTTARVTQPNPNGFGPVGVFNPMDFTLVYDNNRLLLVCNHFRGSDGTRDIQERDLYIFDTGYSVVDV